MRKTYKKEKIIELVRQSIDLFLAQNLNELGFTHIIDVNMSEDLKTAFIYISCPVDKNEKKLENRIDKKKREIVEIFRERFTSKYIPKLKFVCVKEKDVEF